MESWLFSSIISLFASRDTCMSMLADAPMFGMRFALLNLVMVLSTSPSSDSITCRRSEMNSLVLAVIWFLSLIQFSLYTLMSMLRTSTARWGFTSFMVRSMTVACLLARPTFRAPAKRRADE